MDILPQFLFFFFCLRRPPSFLSNTSRSTDGGALLHRVFGGTTSAHLSPTHELLWGVHSHTSSGMSGVGMGASARKIKKTQEVSDALTAEGQPTSPFSPSRSGRVFFFSIVFPVVCTSRAPPLVCVWGFDGAPPWVILDFLASVEQSIKRRGQTSADRADCIVFKQLTVLCAPSFAWLCFSSSLRRPFSTFTGGSTTFEGCSQRVCYKERGVMSSSASPSTVQPSQCARPPTREEIATFMLRNTAHLPLVHQTEDVRQGREAYAATAAGHQHTKYLRWLPPYLYTGADYALVLSACFPNKCIDLSLLNWSANPLFSQRQGNLHVFCQSARSLALPDAPLSALHPERLQNCAACIVEHLKVQHWLYSLSLRFMPASDHDAAALRVVHRHLQSGEPYLHPRQSEHDEVGVCVSVRDCPPLPADHVLRCAPALTPIPVATDAHHHSPLSSSAAGASAVSQPKGGGAETPTTCSSPSAGDAADSAQRQKPWLNYSKPWLLPSLRAAEAKKAASEAAAAKRAQEERERNSRYTAFVAESRNVYEQYVLSCAAVSEKREQLRVIKELVHQEILEGKTLDFKDYAARIRDCK